MWVPGAMGQENPCSQDHVQSLGCPLIWDYGQTFCGDVQHSPKISPIPLEPVWLHQLPRADCLNGSCLPVENLKDTSTWSDHDRKNKDRSPTFHVASAPTRKSYLELFQVRLWMIWDKPMATIWAINFWAASMANPRNGRLKSPRIISLRNSTTNPEMNFNNSSPKITGNRETGRVAAVPADAVSPASETVSYNQKLQEHGPWRPNKISGWQLISPFPCPEVLTGAKLWTWLGTSPEEWFPLPESTKSQ